MTFDMNQAQRRDIETALGRVSLGLDTENVSANPYLHIPSSFVGNAWFQQGEKIVKLNLTEDDSLSFVVSALNSLEYKNVTNVIVSFDYEVTNVKVNYPTLVNVSFASADLTSYKSCETILTTQGHIEVDCSLFDFSADIINNAITEQGFCIGLNFKGDKSNATVKISNVTFGFKYTNLLQDESDSVVNRLNPQIDFWRDGEKLYLQIGDGTGKGRVDRGEIDTYTKDEIDNKLDTKVNIEIGKGLSSQDYSLEDKLKLMNIESNANNYVHPVSHLSSIIKEDFALTNLETSENATQHEINLAIDDKIGNVGGSVDWDDIVDKPSDFPPSVHNHDDRYYTESEVDTALNGKANSSHTHTKSQITDFPTIPSKTSDLTNDTGFITSSSLPTKTSDLVNDGDGTNPFLTQHQSLTNYVQKSNTNGLIKNDGTVDTTQYLSSLPSHNHDDRYYTESEVDTALGGKQDTLVSGTTIKTINNNSLLGSGNITIQGGGSGASNIFDLDPTSQYGDTVVEEGVDRDGSGLGYANNTLIYNQQETKFYYDKNGNADNDNGNELATLNDLPSVPTYNDIVNLIYPVGCIYISVNQTSPQSLFGGTWQQLTDTFLYASTIVDANSTTATGGESTHSLTQSEMPRHTHTQNGHSHSPSGDYDYFIATPTNGGAVSRNSTAGQSGTKVQNLLQSASGVARTNTNSVTATNKYTGGTGTSESASNGSAHNNMPPYMKVFMWKRIS